MQTYIPKDHLIFGWDPENMECYWRQCQSFDTIMPLESDESELASQRAFRQLLELRKKEKFPLMAI